MDGNRSDSKPLLDGQHLPLCRGDTREVLTGCLTDTVIGGSQYLGIYRQQQE